MWHTSQQFNLINLKQEKKLFIYYVYFINFIVFKKFKFIYRLFLFNKIFVLLLIFFYKLDYLSYYILFL